MAIRLNPALAKKLALVVVLIVAAIFAVGLWTAHEREQWRERQDAERMVINAATDCGRNVKEALDAAEKSYQKDPGTTRSVVYGLYAEAIRANCHHVSAP